MALSSKHCFLSSAELRRSSFFFFFPLSFSAFVASLCALLHLHTNQRGALPSSQLFIFFVLATQIYTVRQQPAALVRRRFAVLVLPFNVRPSGLKTQPVRSSPDSVSALKRSRGCTKRHTATYELRPLPPANAAAACIPSQTLSVNFKAKREKKKKKNLRAHARLLWALCRDGSKRKGPPMCSLPREQTRGSLKFHPELSWISNRGLLSLAECLAAR